MSEFATMLYNDTTTGYVLEIFTGLSKEYTFVAFRL